MLETTVFLAGGISHCPDWQADVLSSLDRFDDYLSVFNPRRSDFDINDLDMSKKQIDWERHHLDIADIIVFYFPKETVCPITLFELGRYSALGKQLIVGCHPQYIRKFDVEYQLKITNSLYHVANSKADMIRDLNRHLIREGVCRK